MDTGSRVIGADLDQTDAAAYSEPYDPSTYWNAKNGPGPRVMAASTPENDNVVNGAGEKLGGIKEIMIDVPTGRVAMRCCR